jgi:2-polyprenyl-3-methyl-5-hydroxy-6-metoxy-1,4-benzoquinol methylase
MTSRLQPAARIVRKHLSGVVRALPRPIRWRVRNAFALAQWMRGAATPYDGAFWNFHQGGDWKTLAALILGLGAPRSIVDVGCGDGALLSAIRSLAPHVTTLGIDSGAEGLERTHVQGLVTEQHDLAFFGRRSAADLAARIRQFDMAVCLETAEHLPPWSAGPLVEALTHASIVVFSAAQPDQQGTQHMNERPFAYWRRHFSARGFTLSADDTQFRNAVARIDLPWWYAANIHVFVRRAG